MLRYEILTFKVHDLLEYPENAQMAKIVFPFKMEHFGILGYSVAKTVHFWAHTIRE